MRMVTYVARRLLLVVPTILGVITITFALFQALPIYNQLASHYGNPPRNHPCAFQGSCQCIDDNHLSVHGNSCTCYGSNVTVTPTTMCTDALYRVYIHKLGLDQPVWTQWAVFTYHAFTLQWGTIENNSNVAITYSWLKNVPVTTAIGWMLPYTLELAALSLFFILIVAIPVGNLAAVNRNRPIDQIARVVSFSGFAVPAFLLGSLAMTGLILLLLPSTGFNVHTPWCRIGEPLPNEFTGSWPLASKTFGEDCYTGLSPRDLALNSGYPMWLTGGYASHPTGFPTLDAVLNGQPWLGVDTLVRMMLPALVIAFGSIASILRFVRNSMLEVMNLDFVRTARAKGVPERVVTKRHAGRNSLNVTITVLGLTFAFFIGGFPVIEEVFGLFGIGRMLAIAVVQPLSFAVIFGSTILFTYIVIAANLIVDVLYAYLDPRVRLG
ncbi:MAG TPA: ABC transporter permease [Thermoplasmata archaeon]|nr:ABC transporter permease [Thermoplasmata archaeon]